MVSLYELASPSLRYPECVHGLLKEVAAGGQAGEIRESIIPTPENSLLANPDQQTFSAQSLDQ
jgi:hypothetical protein